MPSGCGRLEFTSSESRMRINRRSRSTGRVLLSEVSDSRFPLALSLMTKIIRAEVGGSFSFDAKRLQQRVGEELATPLPRTWDLLG